MKTNINILILSVILIISSVQVFAQETSKKTKTIEFKVDGVCNSCKQRIENAAIIKGVKMAEWDKTTKKIKVVYIPGKTDEEKIHKSIADAGHDTEKVKATDEAYSKLPACCAYRDGVGSH